MAERMLKELLERQKDLEQAATERRLAFEEVTEKRGSRTCRNGARGSRKSSDSLPDPPGTLSFDSTIIVGSPNVFSKHVEKERS